MNPFQKNPFQKNSQTKIIGYNKTFDEKQKLENIRENMAKLKFSKPVITEQNKEEKIISTKDKIDLLKNINRN